MAVKVTRNTNFIELSYRSRKDVAAAAVVRAVLASYLEFVGSTHQGSAGLQLENLRTEHSQKQKLLSIKQQQLQELSHRVGHLDVNSEDGVIDPIIQRALMLNQALLTAQERRLELTSVMTTVKAARERGEDITQHLAGVETVVGREMLLAGLGMSRQDHQVLADHQRRLLAAQNELHEASSYEGPNHPRIIQLKEEIQSVEQFLENYHVNVSKRFGDSSSRELGPVVERMLTQSVQQAIDREKQIEVSYLQARDEASRHRGSLYMLEGLDREIQRLETQIDNLAVAISDVDFQKAQAPIRVEVVSDPRPEPIPVSPLLRNVIV
ncbi:MAG: hypothetical protein RID07_17410, partial [Lacipirellulaceae bacterium]